MRATPIYLKPLQEAANIRIVWNSQVETFLQEDVLKGVRVKNVKTGEGSEFACDGLFVSVGRQPATELVKDRLTLDEGGYIMAGEDTKTNLPGVFAVGENYLSQGE